MYNASSASFFGSLYKAHAVLGARPRYKHFIGRRELVFFLFGLMFLSCVNGIALSQRLLQEKRYQILITLLSGVRDDQ